MTKPKMPYLLSTYRSGDQVVIQCEDVGKAEEALARVMEWLHSQNKPTLALPMMPAPACIAGGYPHMIGENGKCVGCGGDFSQNR